MKHTKEVYVHINAHGGYVFWDFDASKYQPDLVLVNKQIVEFEVPDDFNPTPKLIENLEAAKAEVSRQFAQKFAEINEQISKLQALTYEVTQ